MDHAAAKLERGIEPVYHHVRGSDAYPLTETPFTQNSGHPLLRELSNTTASLSMTTVPLIEVPDSGNFWLAPSAAVNVALILNELINNALKHAKYDQKVSIKLLEKGSEAKVSIVNSIGLLKRGFDFSSGSGCGTGLGLVRTLMPRRGADLSISCQDGQVCAELVLNPPVLIKSPEPQPLVEGLVWA